MGFVEAELPLEAALASNMTGEEIASRLNGHSPSDLLTASNKRKRSPVSEAMDNISSNADARADLSREKIRHMQLEEIRQKENQQWRKEQEEFERQKAELEIENTIMKQWQVVVENLRQLRKDLDTPHLKDEEKTYILEDIKGLNARRNKLALKLGFRDVNE